MAGDELEHMFFDHGDDDTACLKDVKHTAALHRRHSGAPSWGELELRDVGGGWRHFLYGQAIHCGAGLELQAIEYKADDYGEFSLRLSTGVRVRYEVAHLRKRPEEDGPPWRAMLYVSAGGHTFSGPLEAWMRFRWPEVR